MKPPKNPPEELGILDNRPELLVLQDHLHTLGDEALRMSTIEDRFATETHTRTRHGVSSALTHGHPAFEVKEWRRDAAFTVYVEDREIVMGAARQVFEDNGRSRLIRAHNLFTGRTAAARRIERSLDSGVVAPVKAKPMRLGYRILDL